MEEEEGDGVRGFAIVVLDDGTEELESDVRGELFVGAPALGEKGVILAIAGIEARPCGEDVVGGKSAREGGRAGDFFAKVESGLSEEALFVAASF